MIIGGVIVGGVVAVIGGIVGRHPISFAATRPTPPRGRVNTGKTFLKTTATYGRGAVAFEVFAAAFIAGQGRRAMRAYAWRRRGAHHKCCGRDC